MKVAVKLLQHLNVDCEFMHFRQFDELSNEHEKLLSVCHALRENERLLKEALHGADDAIRVLANRYELLKEYSNRLVIQ